jgi:hypothetical protein
MNTGGLTEGHGQQFMTSDKRIPINQISCEGKDSCYEKKFSYQISAYFPL